MLSIFYIYLYFIYIHILIGVFSPIAIMTVVACMP